MIARRRIIQSPHAWQHGLESFWWHKDNRDKIEAGEIESVANPYSYIKQRVCWRSWCSGYEEGVWRLFLSLSIFENKGSLAFLTNKKRAA